MSNNAAERAIRPVAIGKKNWMVAGSDTGGHRAATLYTIIETAKLNNLNPERYLRDIIARIANHPSKKINSCLGISTTEHAAVTRPLRYYAVVLAGVTFHHVMAIGK